MSHPIPSDEGPYLPEDDSDRFDAEVGSEERMIEEMNRECAMLEAHRKWVKEFNERWTKEKAHEVDG